MWRLYVCALAVAILASPASAQSPRSVQPALRSQDRAISPEFYGGQRRYGIDPDPQVQFDLLRQRNWRNG